MKKCSKCSEIKELNEFYTHNKWGYRAECKLCSKNNSAKVWKENKDKLSKRNKEWSGKNKERRRTYARKQTLKKYGLTPEQFNVMLVSQQNACALCKKLHEIDGEQFDVDHSHNTGKVRGILCTSCNKGLGLFKDNPALLRDAAIYVEARS